MKKCGMITMYDNNFGACLQAYSLQTVLSNMGIESEIIKYSRHKKPVQTFNLEKVISRLRGLSIKDLFIYALSQKFIKGRKALFEEFRRTRLDFSEEQYYRDSNLNILEKLYDIFACGSDMLWSEEFVEDWNFYYIGFSAGKKTIAYAPSFGKNEISEKYKESCKKFITNIDVVSCREEAGVKLIQELSDLKVPQVMDPTMLLTRDEWNSVIADNTTMVQEPYTLLYLFGGTEGKRKKFLQTMENEGTGKNVFLPMNYAQYKAEKLPDIGPLEYLRLFRDAEFVVTDTFHGLMFSIIYRKPFLVLEREDKNHWAKYSDRMTSTLDMFGLKDRYVDSSFTDFGRMRNLDYSFLEDKLEEKRRKSLEYLKKALADGR